VTRQQLGKGRYKKLTSKKLIFRGKVMKAPFDGERAFHRFFCGLVHFKVEFLNFLIQEKLKKKSKGILTRRKERKVTKKVLL
jgi:hypothetical protein